MTTWEHINSKIVSLPEIKSLLRSEKLGKVGFTNGCFDLIHKGHLSYLSGCKDMCDCLIVGLNSDSSVSRLKGPFRPVMDQESRALHLAAFEFVDYVVLFDEDTPYNLISAVQPDILVKGGDYEVEKIVGYDIVKSKGGEVVTLPFVDGCSTSNIINKMNG